jgi:hypothetical protein
MVVSIVMAVFFQSVTESGESLAHPLLSKACCQHGVSSRFAGYGWDKGSKYRNDAPHRTAGETSPPGIAKASARQATFRPAARSLTASVVSD